MVSKVLEVRDRATFIPVLATKLATEDRVEAWYVHWRAGHPRSYHNVALVRLDNGEGRTDPYEWISGTPRTIPVAHEYIATHFDQLNSGDVVDVEFVLGESTTIKPSERFYV